MTLQDQIVAAATELGFEIIGWDDTHAGVRGPGVEFVGTHAELKAYLTGWIDRQVHGFKGERVAIPDEIARYFVVNDILVGSKSQLLTAGAFPGSAFATRVKHSTRFDLLPGDCMSKVVMSEEISEEFGRAVDMDACQLAMDVTTIVTVADDAPPDIYFEMLILGSIVQPGKEHNLPPLYQASESDEVDHGLTRAQVQEMIEQAFARVNGGGA